MSSVNVQRNVFHKVPPRLRGWVLPGLILAVWWGVVASGASDSPLLVSPLAVWQRGVGQVTSGELWVALSASLWRMAWGFGIGSSIGLAVELPSMIRVGSGDAARLKLDEACGSARVV